MNEDLNIRGKLHAYDWLKGIHYSPDDMEIVQVLFKNTRTGFFRNPDRVPIKKGDWVVVEASPGYDVGRVMLTGELVRLTMKKANVAADDELKKVYRIATEADIAKFNEARAREHETMIRSRRIAADLGLDMKIGDVEYQGDGAKAIFYYIADERVDFRKLIRVLADTFHIRIEMKQIGARQEAGRIGGIGPCGRPLCCSSWMQKFVSVGTGAARIQDLSMNPQKLAGQCAKLKCCLNFETDAYSEAAKELPHKGAVLLTQDSEYYLFKTDILARTVTYSTDKHIAANTVTISAARAFEIIELNKQGLKPEQLGEEAEVEIVQKEYVEIVGQDSLTRFDKSKSRKNQKGQRRKGADAKAEKGGDKNERLAGADKERKDSQRNQSRRGNPNANTNAKPKQGTHPNCNQGSPAASQGQPQDAESRNPGQRKPRPNQQKPKQQGQRQNGEAEKGEKAKSDGRPQGRPNRNQGRQNPHGQQQQHRRDRKPNPNNPNNA